MLKLVVWTTTVLVLAALVWQTTAADSLLPPAVSGVLIAIISLLAGLRIGTDRAAAYTKELHRLNKVLAEQNRSLQDANALFLKRQVTSESRAPTELRTASKVHDS